MLPLCISLKEQTILVFRFTRSIIPRVVSEVSAVMRKNVFKLALVFFKCVSVRSVGRNTLYCITQVNYKTHKNRGFFALFLTLKIRLKKYCFQIFKKFTVPRETMRGERTQCRKEDYKGLWASVSEGKYFKMLNIKIKDKKINIYLTY